MARAINTRFPRIQSGFIELFAMELIIGTIATIGFVFLIVNCSACAYYKEKIGYVASQAAYFAANFPGNHAQAATDQFVQDAFSRMNLNVGNAITAVQIATDSQGQKTATVKISAKCPLVSIGSQYIPGFLPISDIGMAISTQQNTGSTVGGGTQSLTLIGNANQAIAANNTLPAGSLIGSGNAYTGAKNFGSITGNANKNCVGQVTGNNNVNDQGRIVGNDNVNCTGTIDGNGFQNRNGTFVGNGP